jgi:hypothetical protein
MGPDQIARSFVKYIPRKIPAIAAPLLALIAGYGSACGRTDTNDTQGQPSAGGSGSGPGTASAGTSAGATGASTSSSGGSSTTAGSASGGSSATAGGATGGNGTGGNGTAGNGTMAGAAGTGIIIEEGGGGVLDGESSFRNPGWKDSWWITGCSSKHDYECYTVEQCPAEGHRTKETFPVGGKPGQHYKVSFTYNGLNEARGYTGGTKDPVPADTGAISKNDSFYRDGDAPPSPHNELRMTVFDDKGVEARHFFMNAFSTAQDSHTVLMSSYKKSIVIVGGGKIEHMVFSSNCRAIDNCGGGEVLGSNCDSPRRLPGEDALRLLPPFYANPNDAYKVVTTNLISISAARTQPWKAQASHLTVKAIEATDDLVTIDYPDPP